MIAKIQSRATFGDLLNYVLDVDGKHNKIVTVLDSNGLTLDWYGHLYQTDEEFHYSEDAEPETPSETFPSIGPMVEDFKDQASNCPSISTPARHFILSYSPEDLPFLNNSRMASDARRFLRELGYGNTQYFMVRHGETRNPHVHIVVNRVDNDFHVIQDKFEIKRAIEIARQITIDNGYAWGEYQSCIENQKMHNPIDKVKVRLREQIIAAIGHSSSLDEFQSYMVVHGIGCVVKTDKEGQPVGITFSVIQKKGKIWREYKFAGSHIHKSCSVRNIVRAISMKQDLPKMISYAGKMDQFCRNHPDRLSEHSRQYYEKQRSLLSRVARERKRLEYEYKDVDRTGKIVVILALLFGGPMATIVPALYYSMLKSSIQHKYNKADMSVNAILDRVAAARNVIQEMEAIERKQWLEQQALARQREAEALRKKKQQEQAMSEKNSIQANETVHKLEQKREKLQIPIPKPHRIKMR